MLKKIKTFLLKSLLVFIVILFGLAIYLYFAIKIEIPTITNDTTLNWKRKTISPNFYKVNNNWLKQSKSGLWELYVEGDGYERGIANGILTNTGTRY